MTDPRGVRGVRGVRAVRNNNPGNIRVGTKWQGLMPREQMTPEQATETSFCVFEDAVAGFRAMAEIFHTYYKRDGICTIKQAITRWAPPSENNTKAYVQSVCDYTGWAPDALFPFTEGSVTTQAALLKGVAIHEAGGWYFAQPDLIGGVQAAR